MHRQFPGGEVLVVVEQELHLAQCLPVPGRPAHARLELTGDAAHQEPGDCGVFLDHRRRPRGPVTQVPADRVRQRVEVPDHRLQRADVERGQGRGVVCLVGHRPRAVDRPWYGVDGTLTARPDLGTRPERVNR